MAQALPARPNLDWLKRAAKERLSELRASEPASKLYSAQLLVARDYGFKSWRELKSRVDELVSSLGEDRQVFEAARVGDVEAVRRAVASGFDPAIPDADGRTLYQIAKERGHGTIEVLVRDLRQGDTRSEIDMRALRAILSAAQSGKLSEVSTLLDKRPDLIDVMGGSLKKATALHLAALHNQHAVVRLLIERGADLDARDFPDNATPLHFAAFQGDLEMVRLVVEAGADVDGKGDDYEIGILGWATCFQKIREDVADYLLANGATLNLWAAIALDRADDVRAMITRQPALLGARMSRNQHRRTPLHHAAAKNRPRIVQLLLELGADPRVTDATGATALTAASQEGAGPEVIDELLAAGAPLDFLTAINLGRYDEAEAMLRAEPGRIGPEGRDTIALHLAVNKKNTKAVRWLITHGVAVSTKRIMWDCNHTALHMTVENGSMELTKVLLDAGADPNIRDDKYNASALGWARYFGKDDLAKLIEEHGGQP
jgi:ankyrin repeat protein